MDIFFGYDIRGIWGRNLNPTIIEKLGNSISAYIKDEETIVIGRDVRCSSDIIFYHLIKSIDKDIIDIGISSTPMLHYSTIYYKTHGIMITASHNPKEYNGLKLVKKGFDYLREDYEAIKNIYKNTRIPKYYSKRIEYKHYEVLREYTNELPEVEKRYKVLYDPGNSIGYLFVDKLRKMFDLSIINNIPDGNFPNRPLDPSKPENIKELIKKSENYDFGLALDGDGDRLAIVRKSSVIPIYIITYILAKYTLSKNDKMVIEVMLPLKLDDKLNDLGIKVIRSRTGHINVKRLALDHNAKMFAEYSGHFGFKEFYYIDDALYTFLKFLKLISEERIDIESEMKEFGYIFERRLDVPIKFSIEEFLSDIENKIKIEKIITVDGYDIRFDDSRILIRKSNTEPLYRIKIESSRKKELENLERLVENTIKRLSSG